MSIIQSLIRLVDPNQHREDEAKRKRWMQQFATPDPGEGDTPEEGATLEKEHQTQRCRVCGRIEREAKYCSNCLADTLTPI